MKFIRFLLLVAVVAAPFPAWAVSSMEERIDKTIDVWSSMARPRETAFPGRFFTMRRDWS